jgi:hypothetical protein
MSLAGTRLVSGLSPHLYAFTHLTCINNTTITNYCCRI